jgi:hypothetical protein
MTTIPVSTSVQMTWLMYVGYICFRTTVDFTLGGTTEMGVGPQEGDRPHAAAHRKPRPKN